MEEWVTLDLGKHTVNMDLHLITLKSPLRASFILVEHTMGVEGWGSKLVWPGQVTAQEGRNETPGSECSGAEV